MITIHPENIYGSWTEGIILDQYSVSSTYIGENEFGHPIFDTKLTEIGELLYKLKYCGDKSTVDIIVDSASNRLERWATSRKITTITPVPFSRSREFQPVFLLTKAFAERLNITYREDLLLNVSPHEAKSGNKSVKIMSTGKEFYTSSVLVIDDIFDSGATLNECNRELREAYRIEKIYVFCIAKKRKNNSVV